MGRILVVALVLSGMAGCSWRTGYPASDGPARDRPGTPADFAVSEGTRLDASGPPLEASLDRPRPDRASPDQRKPDQRAPDRGKCTRSSSDPCTIMKQLASLHPGQCVLICKGSTPHTCSPPAISRPSG